MDAGPSPRFGDRISTGNPGHASQDRGRLAEGVTVRWNPFEWAFQVVVVTLVNLRSLGERRGSSLAAIVGVAGVVAVFVSILSMAEGFRYTMASTGSPDRAIVLRSGSTGEMDSILMREDTRTVADTAGILRTSEGPAVSPELFVILNVPKRTTGTDANVALRGVEPAAFLVRDEVQIIEGRNFEPGRNQVIAGVGAVREFDGVDLGAVHRWGENEWEIVGIFEAGGSLSESELWCDARVLQPAYRRGTSYQSVYAKLETESVFDEFRDTLGTDPRVNVKVVRETDFYAEQSIMITNLITGLGFLIAFMMGVGAVFGALNTMYTAVAARTREIAVLRALGFRASPVVVSVLAESLVLALVGGLIGGGLAYLIFDGFRAATMNFQSFSQVAFAFAVTPTLLFQGISYALIMGLIGGAFPAIRAARLPVARALREL
jgi:putative ABC transport system permease protein